MCFKFLFFGDFVYLSKGTGGTLSLKDATEILEFVE